MIGTGELLVIFGIILVLFGGKKLPEVARNLGVGIREFKKACQGMDEPEGETIEVRSKPVSEPVQPAAEYSKPVTEHRPTKDPE